MKKTFWFSFSYKGKNQGVSVVEAANGVEAQAKVLQLKIAPKFDDVQIYEIDDFSKDPNIKLDKHYTPAEMEELGYKTFSS